VTKKLVSIGLVSVILLILIYTHPIWTRYPGGRWIILIGLSIVAGFFWLIIKLIREIIGLLKSRKTFKVNHLVPTILIAGMLCFTFFIKLSFDIEDKIYGKVIFRACHEGTLNSATFELREGNRFEIHWTGVLFADNFFVGTYKKIGDTLLLDYHSDRPIRFGDRIWMDNQKELLTIIRQENDSLENIVPFYFYYGYCKGLH
jgi:hypothetical protein